MTEAIIQIQDLEKRFRTKNTEVYALQGINLTIRKGDIFGIIGKSGAGKSTLVRCINMLERPTGGSVMFEGKDMCRLGSRDLQIARRSMGMIFQQFNLLMQRTAEENICFPLELAGVKNPGSSSSWTWTTPTPPAPPSCPRRRTLTWPSWSGARRAGCTAIWSPC